MYRKTLLLCFIIFTSKISFAGNSDTASNIISAGYGLGVYTGELNYSFSYSGSYNFTPIGPFYLKFAHRFNRILEMGISAYWISEQYDFKYSDSLLSHHENATYHSYGISIRGNQYLWSDKNFDIYAGVAFGYRSRESRYRSEGSGVYVFNTISPAFPFAFEATIGERFHLSDHLMIYSEVGISKSVFQFGVCYKV